jgi:hypothetical protein
MRIIKVSDGIIFIPYNKFQCFILYLLSLYIGEYSKACNEEVYPMNRGFKLEI